VAHEWGTFTSVQGADGIQFEWNPFVVTDLPRFVYQGQKPISPSRRASIPDQVKRAFTTLQRMETPVIYFYSDEERTVDVRIKFPEGTVTEWYPQSAVLTNRTRPEERDLALRWPHVEILPRRLNESTGPLLPHDPSGSHYYAARETDADYVRISGGKGQAEHEKFLFYRGVAGFRAPLRVALTPSEDYVTLQNLGPDALTDLFVVDLRRDKAGGPRQGRIFPVAGLFSNLVSNVHLKSPTPLLPLAELRTKIADQMQAALVRAGLYPAEARAMVRTWDDSWFGEDGLRVLYLLPGAWADRVLPLSITPAPRETVRVMVGRAEVITPSMEWALLKHAVKYSETDAAGRPALVTAARELGLGRFSEPVARRIVGQYAAPDFSAAVWNLVEAMNEPAPGGKFASK
jgi:hypothetical protein